MGREQALIDVDYAYMQLERLQLPQFACEQSANVADGIQRAMAALVRAHQELFVSDRVDQVYD